MQDCRGRRWGRRGDERQGRLGSDRGGSRLGWSVVPTAECRGGSSGEPRKHGVASADATASSEQANAER
jgi:hypothetical protein